VSRAVQQRYIVAGLRIANTPADTFAQTCCRKRASQINPTQGSLKLTWVGDGSLKTGSG